MICLGIGSLDRLPLVGGHENNLIRLCQMLNKNGFGITIITTPSIHELDPISCIIDRDWGKIYSLSLNAQYGSAKFGIEFFIKSLRLAKELHKMDRFSLIHGHSGYPIVGLIVGLIGKILNVPSVHTLYCSVNSKYFDKYLNRFYLIFIEIIISLSESTAISLEGIGIESQRIKIIPPIIESHWEDLNWPRKRSPKNVLLYLGDLSKTRGLSILIDALSIVVEKIPDTKLMLAINMPLEKYLHEEHLIKKQIHNLGLDDNTVPIGIVDDMVSVMAKSDIFIAPYIDIESIADYPISIVEAMAMGTPVIATNVGGISELITDGKNGLLVPPANSIKLAEAISCLLNNGDKANEIGLNARNFVLNKFNEAKILDMLLEAYARALKC